MWNLGKGYRSIYLQSRNRNTDVENKQRHQEGGQCGWGELGDWD